MWHGLHVSVWIDMVCNCAGGWRCRDLTAGEGSRGSNGAGPETFWVIPRLGPRKSRTSGDRGRLAEDCRGDAGDAFVAVGGCLDAAMYLLGMFAGPD